MPGAKTLPELAKIVGGSLLGEPSDRLELDDVTHDSRQAGPGCLFVAIEGERFDGHDFVDDVVARGAPAVCVTHSVTRGVPELLVEDTRRALGPLASAVHGDPSADTAVVGVTGTNGKTTVAHYVASIAASAGIKAGLMGTIHTRLDGETIEAIRTTPEASDFQRVLAEMRDKGAVLVAVEVSSHGLALDRVRATRFSVAAFTNLSQDHLDFHGDMASYLAAKKKLFEEYEVGTAVINVDDPAGGEIAAVYDRELITVGGRGDVITSELRTRSGRTSFHLKTPWGSASVDAPLVGAFNVSNAAVAAACSVAAGLSFDDVVEGLGSLQPVPGRFEIVSGTNPVLVVVDYAHTPDGVSKAIAAARDLDRGRVIALIGAGGDRDRVKRPLMGQAVSDADLAVITSDNPRSEDPEEIAKAVLGGVALETDVIFDTDRRSAIQRAIDEADDGDVVLVLGRGHEPMQEVAGERRPFDDREVATQALADRRMSANSTPESGTIE
jgi:UDP-N-acetylmuramoyl-L-alanyl-D-glutamate--2,6-diaminopimelate ligase